MSSSQMKVTKTTTLDVPGLGARIKAAREADTRSLTSICQRVGMTTMNWYRIEAEQQSLPIETLRKIEQVLNVDFGVSFDEI
jgi:transcriptional regulator with XRE-family HTH domain